MPYEFTPESFTQFTEDVLKAEGDQAILTTLLADMQTTVTAAIATDKANGEKLARVEAQNQRLLEANANLFQRVGSSLNEGVSGKKPEVDQPVESQGTKEYMERYFAKLDEKK